MSMTIMDFYLSNKENIMHKPVEPIRCPKCGTTVNVNTSMILTSNPPCYEWTCPNCGEKGYTGQGDIITFENQSIPATSGYIQKVDEPDLGVGVTTTNATANSTTNTVALENQVCIEATTPPPKTRSCDIPAPQFIQQGWECPKCGAVLAPNQSYCPFCSPSEYGRSNWVVTTPVRVPLEQYTNPNPSTAISLGDKPKKSGSCTATFATPSETGVTWKLEQ